MTTVYTQVSVSLEELVEQLGRVNRRKLTLQLLAELVENDNLTPLQLADVRKIVEIINMKTEWRFTAYNAGINVETARKMGLN